MNASSCWLKKCYLNAQAFVFDYFGFFLTVKHYNTKEQTSRQLHKFTTE